MIASRMSHIEPSPTVALANKVAELKANGENVISFSVGEPDFVTPKDIIEAAKDALDKGMTHYSPSNGLMAFREEIAKKSKDENRIPCEAANVIVAPTKHTIFMSCLALLDEGDEVLLQDPAWVSYESCIKVAGAKPVFVDTKNYDFHFDSNAIAEAITPKTKMIIVNSPSNPTGIVMNESELKGIADLAVDHDLIVLADEIYEKIIYEGKHISIASFPGMFERTVTVNGLSKAFAMTGWRAGWLVAPTHIQKEIGKLQQHSITCIPSFIQMAGIKALQDSGNAVNEMVAEFKERRNLMLDLLNGLETFESTRPEGAFYLFPKFNSEMGSMDFAGKMLEEAKVAVTPGIAFGRSADKYLRFSYAASREIIKEGIERLKEAECRGVF